MSLLPTDRDIVEELRFSISVLVSESVSLRARISRLEEERDRYREALEEIRDHPHNVYSETPVSSDAQRQYQIGIADGHRCAANAARRVLEEKGE